jgi:hypothetical protein
VSEHLDAQPYVQKDAPYIEARMVALGRMYGDFMRGCMTAGMTREEAFQATLEYIRQMVFNAGMNAYGQ